MRARYTCTKSVKLELLCFSRSREAIWGISQWNYTYNRCIGSRWVPTRVMWTGELILENPENPSYFWMYKLYPSVLAVEMCDDFPPSSPKFFRGIKD